MGKKRLQNTNNLCHLDEGIGQHAAEMFHDGFLFREYTENPFIVSVEIITVATRINIRLISKQ